VTEPGSPYTRLRRALDHGKLAEALAAAAGLERVGLAEALELVLLLARDGEDARFRRAAVRWQARYARELPDVEPAEAQAVLGLVVMLTGPRRRQAAFALAELLDRRELLPAAERLVHAATSA
jgi:hypothetical protein